MSSVTKLETGIAGVDLITHGGLPLGRTTLVAGTAGSAKTVFATQFLAGGTRQTPPEPGVFVTFEERPEDLRLHAQSIGVDVHALEAQGLWAFVDASPEFEAETVVVGPYDLTALLARVRHAVERIGARRVAIDAIGALFAQLPDATIVRRELLRVAAALKAMGVTAVITSEKTGEYDDIGRYGVEDFVADNVIVLRNVLDAGQRRRTIEVLKLRGASHQRGEYPFSIVSGDGIVVLPLTSMRLQARSTDERVSTGVAELDRMTDGGYFRASVVMVSGATGAGKTLTGTHFVNAGLEAGERVLFFAFEESREQVLRNARNWGMDFAAHEEADRLRIQAVFPEAAGLEDHLIQIRGAIDSFRPQRVVVDSLTALERNATTKSYREFVIGLTAFCKAEGVSALYTATTDDLLGGASITDAHISTITDSVILLRYVETASTILRALAVLKMRGSAHEKGIRHFEIDHAGLHIGEPVRATTSRGFLA